VWLQPHYRTNQNDVFYLIILITITLASSNNTLPDVGDWTEICRSCFNVNFNIFLKQLYCASVGKQNTLREIWPFGLELVRFMTNTISRYSFHFGHFKILTSKYLNTWYCTFHIDVLMQLIPCIWNSLRKASWLRNF